MQIGGGGGQRDEYKYEYKQYLPASDSSLWNFAVECHNALIIDLEASEET